MCRPGPPPASQHLSDHEVEQSLAQLTTLESQVSSLRLSVLGEVEQRRLAERHAATGPEAWAAALTGESAGKVAGGLRLARQLRERYHHTREACAAGDLRLERRLRRTTPTWPCTTTATAPGADGP